jgi:hypothetical protein
MSKYKLIQLTNSSIGALDAQAFIPLGMVTRRVNAPMEPTSVFQVTSTTSDVLYVTEPGYYKITYAGTFTAAAAGTVSVTLVTNQEPVYTVSEEATAAEDVVNVTLVYVIRVCPNCCSSPYNCPVGIQIQLGDTATGVTPDPSTANLIVERVY